jgi:hypothetical protein
LGPVPLIALDDGRETYLIDRSLAAELEGEFKLYNLYTVMTWDRVLLLWPAKLPDADRSPMEWHTSALEAAESAMTAWTRMVSDQKLGAYRVSQASGLASEPNWPNHSFKDLLQIAFRDRYIRDLNHVVVKRLKGLA